MNKLYNNHTKKGARVRVLGTNQLGTFADERGRKLNMIVTQYYDKAPGKNDMNVVLETEDGGNLLEHEGGFHFCLAAMLLKALAGSE